MNWNTLLDRMPAPLRRRSRLLAAAGIAVLVLLGAWVATTKAKQAPTAFHEVRRGDFTVSIVEGGTLTSVSEVSIRNEVEGTARVIYIVPEGSYVKKDDLLVQLDSSQAEDQVNLQQINYERARFTLTNAQAQLEIQESTTNSEMSAAALKLKFAEKDLQKFLEGQSLVDQVEASNKWVSAMAQLAVNQETYNYSSNLATKGYETKQRVDADRLAVMNNRNSAIVASNASWILQQFDMPKQREKYESDVREARRELDRVILQSERKIAQYVADLLTSSNTLALNEKKLERDQKNLKATKIHAPQDGLVVYPVSDSHFSSESLIEEGATVRNRQELIKLPDISRMKVSIKVHESHVGMVKAGQPAYVVLDSMPDQRFQGYVEKVAPLPDTQSRWGNPNLKVYKTEVFDTDLLPGIKPGVSARAEIIITNIANALSVPIQAVTTLKGRQVCYLVSGAKTMPVPVQVGMFNTKFIEIASGLKEGNRVLLSPPFDTQERDLEGAVLAAEERAQAAKTNTPARPPTAATPTAGPSPTGPAGVSGAVSEATRGPRLSREERLKRFDKNGDGKLDETELTAMRETLRAEGGGDRPARPDRRAGNVEGGPQRGGNSAVPRSE